MIIQNVKDVHKARPGTMDELAPHLIKEYPFVFLDNKDDVQISLSLEYRLKECIVGAYLQHGPCCI